MVYPKFGVCSSGATSFSSAGVMAFRRQMWTQNKSNNVLSLCSGCDGMDSVINLQFSRLRDIFVGQAGSPCSGRTGLFLQYCVVFNNIRAISKWLLIHPHLNLSMLYSVQCSVSSMICHACDFLLMHLIVQADLWTAVCWYTCFNAISKSSTLAFYKSQKSVLYICVCCLI